MIDYVKTQLNVAQLACARGNNLIFKSVAFQLRAGQVMILKGPNGSGKSSLLRLLAGLAEPLSGTVEFYEQDNQKNDIHVQDLVTYIGHENPVKPPLTIAENLKSWAGFIGINKADLSKYLKHALVAMELEQIAHLPGRVLSSGQKRRLTLARLFLEDKPVWILDEPTVGLDQNSCRLLEQQLQIHLARGGMAILSTHVGMNIYDPVYLDMTEYTQLDYIHIGQEG